MNCPKCNSINVKCLDSRLRANNSVHRIRKCFDCNYRFTTKEILTEEYEAFDKFRKNKNSIDKEADIIENMDNAIEIMITARKRLQIMENMICEE